MKTMTATTYTLETFAGIRYAHAAAAASALLLVGGILAAAVPVLLTSLAVATAGALLEVAGL